MLDKLSLTVSPSTLRHYVWAVMDFGEYAIAQGWTEYVALTKADLPGKNPQPPIVCYSQDEVELLISAARGQGVRWWALMAFLGDSGRRIGEALSLRWEWLRLEAEVPYFELPYTKNGKAQYVPLGKRLREEVFTEANIQNLRYGYEAQTARFLRDAEAFPFPWTYAPAQIRFKRHCRRVGVPYRGFHNLRHTRATELLMRGVPIQAVSALLGHASVATTDALYNHATALSYARYNE